MRVGTLCIAVLAAGVGVTVPRSESCAAVTAEQRKQLATVRRELNKIPGLLRRKKSAEAQKILDEAKATLEKIAKGNERNRTVLGAIRLFNLRSTAVARAGGGKTAAGVSFEKHVAPILQKNCLKCHSENPRGGLRLDTFAGLRKGGGSRVPLVVPGNSARSVLFQRVTARGNNRMPKGGQPLSAADIRTLANWITQGAKFDGKSETAVIGGGGAPGKKPATQVKIAKATGDEKVSFTRDIAPFMVNLCLRCHNDRRKSSGLSLATFEKLMVGGNSGRVVLPGNIDGSRLWDLVGKQRPFKMPRGNARITRTNWRNLRTWIEEGARFDGKDARASLRSLVPTEEELRAAKLAKMSGAEFVEFRRKRSLEQWERVVSGEPARSHSTDGYIVLGNVSTARLEQVGQWAESHSKELRKLFGERSKPLFKGKLAVFVLKDRFGYTEFNQTIHRRETPREMFGHAQVDPSYEDAFVVLQDIGDGVTGDSPGLKVSLIEHLTGAFMKRGGGSLPDWLLRGTGLALAARQDSKNEFIRTAAQKVPDMVRTLTKPEQLFANGTFSPAAVGPVGYTIVEFLLKAGGPGRFGLLVRSLKQGTKMDAALKAAYNGDSQSLARAYFVSLSRRRRSR